MGRKTKLKQIERQTKLQLVQTSLFENSLRHKTKQEDTLTNYLQPYEEFWLCDPNDVVIKTKSSNKTKRLLELVRKTLNRYPVPKILEEVWDVTIPVPTDRFNRPINNLNNEKASDSYIKYGIDFRKWYICVTTGGSLYKEYAKEFFTKKELNIFLNSSLPIKSAVAFAIAYAESNDYSKSIRISKSNIIEKNSISYWKDVIKYLSIQEVASINQINDIVDYLVDLINRHESLNLYGSGITYKGLLKRVDDWHKELGRVKVMGNKSWEGHAIPDSRFELKELKEKTYWSMTQIKTSRELAAEGSAMRHCVYGYQHKCIASDISIWSMKKCLHEFDSGKRVLTIELNNNGEIVQARGVGNRFPKDFEEKVLKKWADDNYLKLKYYRGIW